MRTEVAGTVGSLAPDVGGETRREQAVGLAKDLSVIWTPALRPALRRLRLLLVSVLGLPLLRAERWSVGARAAGRVLRGGPAGAARGHGGARAVDLAEPVAGWAKPASVAGQCSDLGVRCGRDVRGYRGCRGRTCGAVPHLGRVVVTGGAARHRRPATRGRSHFSCASRSTTPCGRGSTRRHGRLLGVGLVRRPLLHHRPTLRNDEAYAIDVSNHQGVIDWSGVAADGALFAYVKATRRKTFVDPYFASNWAAASAAGVRVGAYHFFSLCSSGQEQADAFLRTAPPSTTALPPALDLEILSGCTDRPSPASVQAQLDTFVNRVERAWGEDPRSTHGAAGPAVSPCRSGDGRPRWRTSPFVRPSEPWTVWQVHYFAEVSGVSGRVDLDIVRPLQLVA